MDEEPTQDMRVTADRQQFRARLPESTSQLNTAAAGVHEAVPRRVLEPSVGGELAEHLPTRPAQRLDRNLAWPAMVWAIPIQLEGATHQLFRSPFRDTTTCSGW